MDATRQLTQLVERTRELGLSLLEKPGDRVRVNARARSGPDGGCRASGDEALLLAVVQVALQAAALRVAGADDARARGGQLGVRRRRGERLRHEVGEVAEALLGPSGSGLSSTDEATSAPRALRQA